MPERDFVEYLLLKKDSKYEPFLSAKRPEEGKGLGSPSKGSSLIDDDDQDLRPMDLEANQNQRQREDRKEDRKEESKFEKPHVPYIDRCKAIGRIGGKEVKLDNKTAFGKVIHSNRDCLDIEATSNFASIRATAGVFSGRYYYEAMIKTNGLMQIGWCTL